MARDQVGGCDRRFPPARGGLLSTSCGDLMGLPTALRGAPLLPGLPIPFRIRVRGVVALGEGGEGVRACPGTDTLVASTDHRSQCETQCAGETSIAAHPLLRSFLLRRTRLERQPRLPFVVGRCGFLLSSIGCAASDVVWITTWRS